MDSLQIGTSAQHLAGIATGLFDQDIEGSPDRGGIETLLLGV